MTETTTTRWVYCVTCNAGAEVPGGRAPYGWYALSVQVPEWFNSASGKSYRWAGVFCSPACLAGHQGELERQAALMRGVYEVGG